MSGESPKKIGRSYKCNLAADTHERSHPQMLARYGRSARSARARARDYDVMGA
jgi:hypothetical protein